MDNHRQRRARLRELVVSGCTIVARSDANLVFGAFEELGGSA